MTYKEAKDIYMVGIDLSNSAKHYGTKRHSGRYPWGSGENPYQHSGDFLARVEELKKQGKNEKEIADELDLSTTQLRLEMKLATHERRQLEVDRAKSLLADGYNPSEIARIMGKNSESSIRNLLREDTKIAQNKAQQTAEKLKAEVETKGMLDVGKMTEQELGVSRGTLDEALYILERDGYSVFGVGVQQVNRTGQQTTVEVLAKPDIAEGTDFRSPQHYAYNHLDEIQPVGDYHSDDGGLNWSKREYPSSLDSSRVMIRYADDGGKEKDGLIELRPGVDDLSLGNSNYAQVRILVDGTHYMKGMAVYNKDIPDGIDVIYNSNKAAGTDKYKVFKPIDASDPDNPFKAYIKANGQTEYFDENGNRQLSVVNKLKEESDWNAQSRTLSQQFLSKQPVSLIKSQLQLTYADYESKFEDINSLTNPAIKQKMLEDFAGKCDSAAVDMKAMALPRQRTQVIIPLTKIGDNEIYAPNYNNGEEVVLIRYPHGGTFEIPRLKVNNNNADGKRVIGPLMQDCVGINSHVAGILSGADFDGDTVVVIPVNDKVKIQNRKPLEGLKGFEPKEKYSYKEGCKLITTDRESNKQMGVISNLITDMTLQGATSDELARAVRHSMVVIDAKKHKLDYTQSYKDNGIDALKAKYQKRQLDDGSVKVGGAATLLSRRKQTVQIPETKGSPRIDDDGHLVWKQSGRTYIDKKTGKEVLATKSVSVLSELRDARKLSSGTMEEEAYASYSNKMFALADKARKALVNTPNAIYDPESAKKYKAEVDSLNAKLLLAETNAPRERYAQRIANARIKAKVNANPDLKNDKKELRKVGQIELQSAREKVGRNYTQDKEKKIRLTSKEWEAIQAGAVSHTKLRKITRFVDEDDLYSLALPKHKSTLTSTQLTKLKLMGKKDYTIAEIADSLGVSTSTVEKYLGEI